MPTALVTGASRGVGKGVASALSSLGYLVYATGRSILTADLPEDVVRIPCNHLIDDETARAFAQVESLDVLVNCAWGGYEKM